MTNRTNLLMLLFIGAAFFGTATLGAGNAAAQPRRPLPPGQHAPPGPWTPAPSQRSPFELGFGGSLNIPFDKSEDVLDMNASIHGTMLYGLGPFMKFEGDIGYWFLQSADDKIESDDDPSLLTLTGGLRLYPSPNIHLDGGLGLYHFDDWEYTQDNVTMNYDAESNLGFYGGLGFDFHPLDITVRAHYSDFYVEEFWNVGVALRVFFPTGGSGRGGRPRR